jgi:hypothetical protein
VVEGCCDEKLPGELGNGERSGRPFIRFLPLHDEPMKIRVLKNTFFRRASDLVHRLGFLWNDITVHGESR